MNPFIRDNNNLTAGELYLNQPVNVPLKKDLELLQLITKNFFLLDAQGHLDITTVQEIAIVVSSAFKDHFTLTFNRNSMPNTQRFTLEDFFSDSPPNVDHGLLMSRLSQCLNQRNENFPSINLKNLFINTALINLLDYLNARFREPIF